MGKHLGALVALDLRVIVTVDAGDGREQRQLLPVDSKAVKDTAVTLAYFQGRQAQECPARYYPRPPALAATRMSYSTPSVEFAVKALPEHVEVMESTPLVAF